MPSIFEGNQILGLIDRMRSAFVGRDEIVQRGADATRSTNQTGIANGVVTPVQFSGVTKDTDTLWNGAQPTRLTAHVAGWYICSGEMVCSFVTPVAGTETVAGIRKNGTTSIALNSYISPSNSRLPYISVARVAYLGTGDYIELTVIHDNTSSTMSVLGGLGYSPALSMVRFP